MRYLALAFSLSCIAGTAAAADPAAWVAADAILECRIPDTAATVKRWEASPYPKLVATKWGQSLWAKMREVDARIMREKHASPLAALAQVRSLAAGIGAQDSAPVWTLAVAPLGLEAMTLALGNAAPPIAKQRVEEGLVVAGSAKPALASTWKIPAGDLIVRLDQSRMPELYQAFGLPLPAMANIRKAPPVIATLAFDPIGMRESFDCDMMPGLEDTVWPTADVKLFASLPATTLCAAILACDPALLKKSFEATGFDENDPSLAQADAVLASIGLPRYLDLLRSFDGTSLFFIEEGAPFPSITVVARLTADTTTKILDALVVKAGFRKQEDGSLTKLLGMLNVTVAKMPDGAIVATSNPLGLSSWTERQPGFTDHPEIQKALKELHATPMLAGVSRSGATWSAIAGLAQMPLMATGRKEFATLANDLRLAGSYGFMTFSVTGKHVEGKAGGLFGGPCGIGLAAGVVAAPLMLEMQARRGGARAEPAVPEDDKKVF